MQAMKALAVLMMTTAISIALPAAAQDARQLFNGRDLEGWQHAGFGGFEVEDGLLRPQGGVGILWYEDGTIGDARLHIVYKVDSERDNSGVFIRIPEPPEDPWMPVEKGLEIQINGAGKSPYHVTGAVYTLGKAVGEPGPTGEWNVMDILLDGNVTEVRINGEFVSRYAEGDEIPPRQNEWDPAPGPRPVSGYIGLQNHPQGANVFFREISLLPLDE
jgi:hypothetical protein